MNLTLLVRSNLKSIFFLSFLKNSFAPAAYYSSKVIIFYLWHPDRPLPWKRLWSWKQASWFTLRSEFQSVQLLFTEELKTHLIRQISCYRGKRFTWERPFAFLNSVMIAITKQIIKWNYWNYSFQTLLFGCSSAVYLSLLLSSGITHFLLTKYPTDVAQHSSINFRVDISLYQKSTWISPSEQK